MLSLFKFSRQSLLIGLDIGSCTIKAVMLDMTAQRHYRLIAMAMIDTPERAVIGHEIHDTTAVARQIARLRQQLPGRQCQVAAAIGGAAAISKLVYVDSDLKPIELEQHIERVAENVIPFPRAEVDIDYEWVPAINDSPVVNERPLLLSAARRDQVASRTAVITEAQLRPRVMDIEGYALAQSWPLIMEQLPPAVRHGVVAMIDLGAHMMTCCVLVGGMVSHTSEQALTELVQQETPVISFVQAIRRMLQVFLASQNLTQVDHLVLSGGRVLQPDFFQQIAQQLGLPVTLASPFAHCLYDDAERHRLACRVGAQYMIAAGLALRSFGPWYK